MCGGVQKPGRPLEYDALVYFTLSLPCVFFPRCIRFMRANLITKISGKYICTRCLLREPVTSAGLKFKAPFIQDVNPIDKRVLEWDGNSSDMPTKDKLYISADLFARWRIIDPLQYFLRLRDERSAQARTSLLP